jgi:hypothetical protein
MSTVEADSKSLAVAIADSRKENREDHDKIFSKLTDLAVAQAGAITSLGKAAYHAVSGRNEDRVDRP